MQKIESSQQVPQPCNQITDLATTNAAKNLCKIQDFFRRMTMWRIFTHKMMTVVEFPVEEKKQS
jgi:hypothetical protein